MLSEAELDRMWDEFVSADAHTTTSTNDARVEPAPHTNRKPTHTPKQLRHRRATDGASRAKGRKTACGIDTDRAPSAASLLILQRTTTREQAAQLRHAKLELDEARAKLRRADELAAHWLEHVRSGRARELDLKSKLALAAKRLESARTVARQVPLLKEVLRDREERLSESESLRLMAEEQVHDLKALLASSMRYVRPEDYTAV